MLFGLISLYALQMLFSVIETQVKTHNDKGIRTPLLVLSG
jgi:hypothetical protein